MIKKIGYENDEDITIECDNTIHFIQAKDYKENFDNYEMKKILNNWIKYSRFEKYDNKEKIYTLILSGKSSINKEKLKESYNDTFTHNIIKQFKILEYKSFDVLEQISIKALKKFQKGKKVNIKDEIVEKQYKALYSEVSSKIDKSMKIKTPYIVSIKNWQHIVENVINQINDETYNINTSERIEEIKSSDELINKFKKTNRAYQQLLSVFPQDQDSIMIYLVYNILYNEFRDIYNELHHNEIDNWECDAIVNYKDTINDKSIMDNNKLFTETLKRKLNIEFIKSSPLYSNGCYIYLTEDFIDKQKQITWNKYEK